VLHFAQFPSLQARHLHPVHSDVSDS
jgi:hypothetical protein